MIEVAGWVTSVVTIVGTILNIYKNKWGFFLWAVTNLSWIAIDIYIGLYSQAIMFVVMFATSVWGFLKWNSNSLENE